jgi:diguanylate cyclase (GGDEF)-like protein/PAS domain S-box-containing protein
VRVVTGIGFQEWAGAPAEGLVFRPLSPRALLRRWWPWRRRRRPHRALSAVEQAAAPVAPLHLGEAAEHDDRFRALIQSAADIILVVTADGTVLYQAPSVERALGYAPADLAGTSLSELVHPADRDVALAFIMAVAHGADGARAVEWRMRRRDGTWLYWEFVAANLLGDARVGGLVLTGRDVTGRKALEEQLEHRAFHDELSGLPNRRLFLDRLGVALARTDRRHDSVAVLFLDLDNLKAINDSFGHEAGDRLLVEIGRRLQGVIRPSDTVARFGGDEFAVLLEDIADVHDAIRVAERISAQLHAPMTLGGRDVISTASIGIAMSSSSHDQPEELLRRADDAVYQAKRSGKARFEVYDAGVSPRRRDFILGEAELRRALSQGEFRVYYQPAIDLHSGRVREVEALLRWSHPLRGLLAPAEFIPLADETGLMLPLSQWALDDACRRLRVWQVLHPTAPPLMLSVNISARQFLHPSLATEIARHLTACRLEPHTLALEVSAGVVAWDLAAAVATLGRLRALGVQLTLDNVGTGGLDVARLGDIPIDAIKLDRTLVEGIGRDPGGEAGVQAVLQPAERLGLRVTAVGVETADQINRLRALGSGRIQVQGYYFARPLPADAFAPLVAAAPWWTEEHG